MNYAYFIKVCCRTCMVWICLSLFLVVGKWQGVVKIKMWFTAGGAIEFGQAMLRAGQLGMLIRLVMIFYETSQ